MSRIQRLTVVVYLLCLAAVYFDLFIWRAL